MPADYTLTRSDDPVKSDLELTCNVCGAYVCDAEDRYTLQALALTAADHTRAAGHGRL